MKNKGNMVLWVLIVVVVIAVLVFLTLNRKELAPADSQLGQAEQSVNNMTNTQELDGVRITILKEGSGEGVKTGDTVAMNYTGMFVDGTVFDSNVDPKFGHVEPFEFTLGSGQVIKGWDVGIVGMKVGEKRNLAISPELAYGEVGAGTIIPPNTTLNFEVELLSVK